MKSTKKTITLSILAASTSFPAFGVNSETINSETINSETINSETINSETINLTGTVYFDIGGEQRTIIHSTKAEQDGKIFKTSKEDIKNAIKAHYLKYLGLTKSKLTADEEKKKQENAIREAAERNAKNKNAVAKKIEEYTKLANTVLTYSNTTKKQTDIPGITEKNGITFEKVFSAIYLSSIAYVDDLKENNEIMRHNNLLTIPFSSKSEYSGFVGISGNEIFIAMHGTEITSIRNILTDLWANRVCKTLKRDQNGEKTKDLVSEGTFHQGFIEGVKSFKKELYSILDSITEVQKEIFKELKIDVKIDAINLIGHSLGAALAQILAMDLCANGIIQKEDNKKLNCFLVAPPTPFSHMAAGDFKQRINEWNEGDRNKINVVKIINQRDIVPTLTAATASCHLSNEVAPTITFIEKGFGKGISSHFVSKYIENAHKVQKALSSGKDTKKLCRINTKNTSRTNWFVRRCLDISDTYDVVWNSQKQARNSGKNAAAAIGKALLHTTGKSIATRYNDLRKRTKNKFKSFLNKFSVRGSSSLLD